MLLVIFGAGASYDSVPHLPPPAPGASAQNNWTPTVQRTPSAYEQFRPPLANQLFEDRSLFVDAMQAFPECMPIIPLLRGVLPVEQQLAALELQEKTYPARRSQLLAIRFYLHTVLWQCQMQWQTHHKGINNYATFLDAIERWRHENGETVCCVTFNYDTMLEAAMTQVLGLSFDHFGRYITDPRYQLVKLHGSIDWGLEVEIPSAPTSARQLLEQAESLRVSARFRKADLNVTFDDRTAGFPALAIPVEKKSEFMCPPDHIQVLGNSLSRVTKIVTIGWRATEQHFLKMLHERLTGVSDDVDVMIISGNSAGANETLKNFGMHTASSGKRALLDNGFTGLIGQIGYLEGFLR